MRMMRTRARRFAAALGVLSIFVGGGAFGYDYFFAHILDIEMDQHEGRKVMVVDTLVRVWDYQDVDGHLRFDTELFRCAVPNTETDAVAYLREVHEKVQKGDRTPPLLALYGTVARAPLWGPVKGGASDGVESETILIICDRIEKPRERFFDEDR